jgi:hypothetical protein
LDTSIGEHWRERLRELDCSRTRLSSARKLSFHFAVPLQEEGLSFLGQLDERGFVFGAPMLGSLIAFRSLGRSWIRNSGTGLGNFWLLQGWIGNGGSRDCFAWLDLR